MPVNKCVKYVPGLKALHRTAFSPLRCAKAAVYAGVSVICKNDKLMKEEG